MRGKRKPKRYMSYLSFRNLVLIFCVCAVYLKESGKDVSKFLDEFLLNNVKVFSFLFSADRSFIPSLSLDSLFILGVLWS